MSLNSNHDYSSQLDTVNQYEIGLRQGSHGYFGEREFIDIIAHYEETDRIEDALKALDLALEYHPFTVDFYILKASLLLELFMPNEALRVIAHGKTLGYEQSDIWLLEAESYMLLNNLDMALASIKKAKALESHDGLTEVYFCEAIIYEHFQLYNGCFDSLKNTLLCEPNFQPALNKIWWCTEMTERYLDSRDLHINLINNEAYNSRAWFNLGHAYTCLGEDSLAIEAFEFAFVIDSKFEFAYRDCAEIYIKHEKYDEALRCYEEVMEFIAPDSNILAKCGYCHTRLRNFQRANDFYIKSIALDPENAAGIFGLAANYYHLGQYHEARNAVDKAIALDATREEYILLKAAISIELDLYNETDASFIKAIEIAPENELCWMKYFHYLILEAKNEEALELISESEFYHQSKEITTSKIIALFACGKTQEAHELLFSSLENDDFDHHLFYTLKPESMPDYLEMIFR